MTKIIAFSGKKQSGKNTSANFIYSLYLAQTSFFKEISLTPRGTIEVKKQDTDNWLELDVVKYYYNIGTIDAEIADVINFLTPTIKIYSFADALKKDICMDILGLTYEQCYGSDEDKNVLTHMSYENQQLSSRDIMQLVGTDFFRKIYPDIWPSATLNKIKKESTKLALITDCRFPNEVSFIKNNGGKVVRLTRQLNNIDPATEHISEKILDKDNYDWSNFDYVIQNENSSIEEQCQNIYDIMLKEAS
jgi:hypothetical protein